MKTNFVVLLALGLAGPGVTLAQESARNEGPFRPGWYAAPMLTYFMADNERCGVDDGLGLSAAFGNRGDFANLELWGQFLSSSYDCADGDPETPNESGDVKLNGGGIALVAGPFFEDRILSRFFGVVGFGIIQRKDHPRFANDDSTIFGDAGVGYMHPLAFRLFDYDLNLRAEARYRYDVQQPPRPAGTPAQFQDIIVNVGLQIPLSRPDNVPEAEPAPVAVVAAADTDADDDGVRDAADQCPGTRAGAAVDDVGCVRDSGAGAGAGAVVAQEAGKTVVLSGVTFELNSDQLTSDALVILDAIAKDLLTKPEQSNEIGGHTDASGDDAYNQDLSQRRAESARAYLVEQGINPDKLTAVGYGESQPIDSNDTAEGRAKNRRVELKVL